MLNKNNRYFEELRQIGREYEDAKAALDAEKHIIVSEHGWDSDEYKAWKEKRDAMGDYPVSAGACKAYRAWAESVENEYDEVEFSDSLWDREVKDFIETLRNAGIENLILTGHSTGLMADIHNLESEGCKMVGTYTRTTTVRRWGAEEEKITLGIRFTV